MWMDADWRGRCGSNTVAFTGQFAGADSADEHDGELNLAQSWPLSERDSARDAVSRLRSLNSQGLGGFVRGTYLEQRTGHRLNEMDWKECHWTTERGKQRMARCV